MKTVEGEVKNPNPTPPLFFLRKGVAYLCKDCKANARSGEHDEVSTRRAPHGSSTAALMGSKKAPEIRIGGVGGQ